MFKVQDSLMVLQQHRINTATHLQIAFLARGGLGLNPKSEADFFSWSALLETKLFPALWKQCLFCLLSNEFSEAQQNAQKARYVSTFGNPAQHKAPACTHTACLSGSDVFSKSVHSFHFAKQQSNTLTILSKYLVTESVLGHSDASFRSFHGPFQARY